MSSIVIIGKGNSVLKCTQTYVDSCDKVCFINYPRVTGYEKNISTRCDYHICLTDSQIDFMATIDTNITWDTDLKKYIDYDYYINNTLGITHILQCGNHPREKYMKYIKNKKNIQVDVFFRRKMMQQMRYLSKYNNWFPSSGILAFDFFINSKQFKTITLVGYDFYTSNDKTLDINKKSSNYYFLHDDNIKNIRDNTIGNTHNPQQSIDYIIKRIKEHPDIQFIMYTNCTLFPTLSNLEIR